MELFINRCKPQDSYTGEKQSCSSQEVEEYLHNFYWPVHINFSVQVLGLFENQI